MSLSLAFLISSHKMAGLEPISERCKCKTKILQNNYLSRGDLKPVMRGSILSNTMERSLEQAFM